MSLNRIFPFAVAIFAAGQIAAQSSASITLVKAGRLLNPRSGNVLSAAGVLIENGKIKEVGPPVRVQAKAPADAKIIDLGNATLLPGLIDSHTHLLVDPIGPAEVEWARQAVRQNEFQNVDVIKVAADENLTVPELGAVIEEAHRKHLKVAVHAVDKTSIQTSIDAGADSIEHGNEATDAQLKQMHDKGIFFDFTPTSYGDFFTKIFDGTIAMSLKLRPERRGSDERTRQRYNDLAQQLLKGAEFPDASDESRDRVYDSLVQRVMKSGVKFAAGYDMGWFYPGKTRGE